MSSNFPYQQNFADFSQEQNYSEKDSNPLKILHQPVETIERMTKTENQILGLIKDSLNLQYESFDFKFNTFKDLIQEFKLKRDQDQTELFNMFGISNDVCVKPQKPKVPPISRIPELISEKSNSFEDSIPRGSHQLTANIKPEKKIVKQTIPKMAVSQVSQSSEIEPNIESNIQVNLKRKRKQMQHTQSDFESDSGLQQKEEKPVRVKRGESITFHIESNGPDRYEVTRKRLEFTIQNKGRIYNHHQRIAEILFHPYSTLQMLLDYNESIDYPLILAKNHENGEIEQQEDDQ